MSTATEIARLQAARNTIRNKMVNLGLGTSTDLLDDLATEIDGITNRGAVTATVQEGDTYTIPAGYHNGSGTVSGVSGGGNYSLQAKGPITPTKSQQSISADNGYYGLSAVTIAAIPEAYQDVSSVTAAASDVLATKIIVASDGTITTGTMTNNGAVSQTLDVRSGHTSYTVPSGYHNGSGTVSIVTETKSATPTTSSQDITPTAGKVLSKVTVAAIPAQYGDTSDDDAGAGDILYGKKAHSYNSTLGEAVAITGSMTNNGAVSQTLDVRSGHTSYTVPAGYHNGSGTVSITTETKSVTPTTSSQDVTPTDGKVLSKVTVDAIPSAYQDVSNVDATAGDVLSGKVIVAADGTEVTGSMTNNGAVSQVLDVRSGYTSYTVPAGYHNGSGTVSIVTEEKGATPDFAEQVITPTDGKVLSKVTVDAISYNYADTTGDTATAAQVLYGYKAHTILNGIGTRITGTMTDNGAVSKTLDATTSNQSYTVPAGYHNGSGTVSITLEEKSATPSTSSQNITPTSGKVLSKVTVAAIPAKYGDTTGDDATAAQVLSGYKAHTISSGSAVQITGSMTNNGAVSKTLDATTDNQSYTVPAGYHNGSGTVSITLETKSATPTTSSQDITPTSGKVLSKVTVAAIPAKYGDTTGDDAIAANLLAGKYAHTIVNGTATQIEGTMANNGAISGTIDGLTTTSYSISAGYTSGGTVSLTNDIETALAAI